MGSGGVGVGRGGDGRVAGGEGGRVGWWGGVDGEGVGWVVVGVEGWWVV